MNKKRASRKELEARIVMLERKLLSAELKERNDSREAERAYGLLNGAREEANEWKYKFYTLLAAMERLK